MTLINRIALSVFALLAITLVMGLLAVQQFDGQRQKDRIETLVLDLTGRELQINGDVNVNFFPRPGLQLADLRMSNAAEFADSDFATAGSVELQLGVLPLLAGRINIEKLDVDNLSLKLQRDADGKTNWDDLMAATAVVETESEDNVVREIEAGAPIIAALSAGDIEITGANVSYTDARDESYLALNDLNLRTAAIVLSEAFPFESDFSMISSFSSGMTSVVSTKGEVSVDLVNNVYVLQDLKLSTVNSGVALPIYPLPLSISGELIADLNAGSLVLNIADGLLTGVPVSGMFQVSGLQDDLRLNGELSSGEFDATSLFAQASFFKGHELPPELLQKARISARFNHRQNVLQIREFEASVSDIVVNGDFQIANPTSSGVVSGWLQTNPFNPAPWASGLGLNIEPGTVMQQMQLSTDVRQSGQLLSFNQIDFQIDNTNITGSIEVSNIHADVPPLTYDLSVDAIDLDSYLPMFSANESLESQDEFVSKAIPADVLQHLKMNGTVSLQAVTAGGARAENVTVTLLAEDGEITLPEITADMYTGSFFSSVSLNVQNDEPLLTVTGNLNGLDAEPLLQDLLNGEAPLTGIANLSIDLLGRGTAWRQLIEFASGVISLRATEGQLKGIDVASELREASRRIDNQQVPGDDNTSVPIAKQTATEFSEYSLSAVLADGVLKSDDLVFITPYLRITGEGGVDINRRTVDYLLHLIVTSENQLEPDETLDRLADIELTIPFRGPLTDESLDLPGLLLKTFQTGLFREVESRYTSWSQPQAESAQEQIESQKEALRQRLDEKQQAATESAREKKQQSFDTTEDPPSSIENETSLLKNRLHNNLKENLNDILSEN